MAPRTRTTAPTAALVTGTTGVQEFTRTLPAMTAGPAAAQVAREAVAPIDATGLAIGGTEGRGARARENGSTGTGNHGDAYRASSSSSPTDGSRRVSVPEITGIKKKRQVLPSLTDVASPAALLGRLTMSVDRAMPVSSNLAHARTSAIDSAAAAAAIKHTAEGKRAYKHLGLQDVACILFFLSPPRSTLRTPCLIFL